MKVLTPIEKMIFESLHEGSKDLLSLSRDLKTSSKCLLKNLIFLTDCNYLYYQNDLYHINNNKISDIQKLLQNKTSKWLELKTIFGNAQKSFLKKKDSQHLVVSKAFLTKDQKEYVETELKKIERFLKDSQKKHAFQELSQKEVFYWGHQSYGDLVQYHTPGLPS